MTHTKIKTKLAEVAEILSGVYAKCSPVGKIVYLQGKDLLMTSPENQVKNRYNKSRVFVLVFKPPECGCRCEKRANRFRYSIDS